jgi:hypothetical protein
VLKPLGEALGAWSPGEFERWEKEPHRLLAAVWPEIVGPEIARNSQPIKISGGALTIATRSNAWSQQLSFFAERILAAVRARLTQTPVDRLQFRVGKLPGSTPANRPRARTAAPAPQRPAARPPAETATEAIARFRGSVDEQKRAKRAAGWKECTGCGASISPRGHALCIACANARARRTDAEAARLLFEAPWLGYAGTAELVDGLTWRDYQSIRARLLTRWWETLARARASKRLSRDGRERLIASSYVVLKSKLPPEAIEPATMRNVLGDELHDLIYGTERQTKTHDQ